MLRIEPLGTRVVLPAFVIGYEITGVAEQCVDDWDESPDWLLTLNQQAGGYCFIERQPGALAQDVPQHDVDAAHRVVQHRAIAP